jgi:hypothetical protein
MRATLVALACAVAAASATRRAGMADTIVRRGTIRGAIALSRDGAAVANRAGVLVYVGGFDDAPPPQMAEIQQRAVGSRWRKLGGVIRGRVRDGDSRR